MKRLLTLLAIAGLGSAMACGDDSGGGDNDGNNQESVRDAGSDSAVPNRGVQITNLGATCETPSDCEGPQSAQLECITELPIGDSQIPDGYCTARCNSALECGAGGSCPAADLPAIPGLSDLIPKQCFKTCNPRDADPCPGRADFRCSSIKDGLAARGQDLGVIANAVPALSQNFCFPEIEVTLPDGGPIPGAGDAGAAALVVTGLDAGL